MGLLFLVFGIVLTAVVIYVAYELERRRRRQFELLARTHGLAFYPQDPFGTLEQPFAIFHRGHSRKVRNVLVGKSPTDGSEVRAFDYTYTTGSGKNSQTHHKTCVMGYLGTAWPILGIEREGLFNRFKDFVGVADIELESEEFNRTFEVRCADARFATAFLDPTMMEVLLRSGIDDGLEVGGAWMIETFDRVSPPETVALVQRSDAIRSNVPELLWELYPARALPQ